MGMVILFHRSNSSVEIIIDSVVVLRDFVGPSEKVRIVIIDVLIEENTAVVSETGEIIEARVKVQVVFLVCLLVKAEVPILFVGAS